MLGGLVLSHSRSACVRHRGWRKGTLEAHAVPLWIWNESGGRGDSSSDAHSIFSGGDASATPYSALEGAWSVTPWYRTRLTDKAYGVKEAKVCKEQRKLTGATFLPDGTQAFVGAERKSGALRGHLIFCGDCLEVSTSD